MTEFSVQRRKRLARRVQQFVEVTCQVVEATVDYDDCAAIAHFLPDFSGYFADVTTDRRRDII